MFCTALRLTDRIHVQQSQINHYIISLLFFMRFIFPKMHCVQHQVIFPQLSGVSQQKWLAKFNWTVFMSLLPFMPVCLVQMSTHTHPPSQILSLAHTHTRTRTLAYHTSSHVHRLFFVSDLISFEFIAETFHKTTNICMTLPYHIRERVFDHNYDTNIPHWERFFKVINILNFTALSCNNCSKGRPAPMQIVSSPKWPSQSYHKGITPDKQW